MDTYIIISEFGKFKEIKATNHEMAYRDICCWYMPSKKIVVIKKDTKETKIYTREIDKHGNLIRIIEN